MRRRLPHLGFVLPLVLTACGGHNSTPPLTGGFALINGIADSNGLSADIANIPAVGPIDFGGASGITIAPNGSYMVQLMPGASGSSPFTVNGVNIEQDNLTTVVGYGTLAAGTQGGLTAEMPLTAPASGNLVVQPVDAAYALSNTPYPTYGSLVFIFSAVGVYPPNGPTLTATFGSAGTSQVLTVPAGTYESWVYADCTMQYPPGNQCADSISGPPVEYQAFSAGGHSGGITLPPADGANVIQLVAIDATSAQDTQYNSPISLVMLDDKDQSTQLFSY